MTAPVNTTFTPGTTITTEWCNGVNDHVNNLETEAHTAANITNVPSGNITSTTVQGAIDELDGKVGEVFNVLDFGATGDGVTDDTAAVQAALDATWAKALTESFAGGVSLYFPAGTYKCSSLKYGSDTNPGVRPSRVYIYGVHAASIILSTVTTGQLAFEFTKYTGVSNFGGNTIKDMTLRSQNYQGTGLHFNATNWMTRVDGCIFQGFDYNYTNYSGITTTIQNSFFLSAQVCNFYSAPSPDTEAGYHEIPANLRFQNNYVGQGLDADTGNVVYSQAGLLAADTYAFGANAVIKNNVFEGNIDYAVYLGKPDGSTTYASYLIDGNWFESPGYPTTKDQLYGACKNSTISNNFFTQAPIISPGSSYDPFYGNQMFGNSNSLATTLNLIRNYAGQSNTVGYSIGGVDAGIDFTGIQIAKKSSSLDASDAYPLLIFRDGVPQWYYQGNGLQYINSDAGTEGQVYLRNNNNAADKRWHIGANDVNAFVVYNQGTTGVYIADGATSWTANSDERVKDIIEPITDAANKVSTLRAVIGKYKQDEEGTRRSFLIAQDVQAVLPEAVNVQSDEQGTLGLQYTDVIPLLVAAIKEQNAKIAALEEQVLNLGVK